MQRRSQESRRTSSRRAAHRALVALALTTIACSGAAAAATTEPTGPAPTGRAGTVAPAAAAVPAGDLGPFRLTYYWFAPERWFVGQLVAAPGLPGSYREDFLYSARGVTMEGTGTDLSGSPLTVAVLGGHWVTRAGVRTDPGPGGWSHGSPYWRDGGYRTAAHEVTFQHADGSWENGPPAPGSAPLPYHDSFAPGIGSNVTVWHSVATDRSVIPRGTPLAIPALASTPAHGCFSADDTGSAIIGAHLDVLVPPDTDLATLPETADVQAVPAGGSCQAGMVLPPGRTLVGVLRYVYSSGAREAAAQSRHVAIPGVGGQARESFLYGPRGVVMEGFGALASGRSIVALRGGWWVDRLGRRTRRTARGWSAGVPVWRDGGWRNAAGAPTHRRRDGSWTRGRGSRYRRPHDRFRLAEAGELVPWGTVGVPRGLVPAGTRLDLAGLPASACFTARGAPIPTNRLTVVVVVPHQAAVPSLPARGPVSRFGAGTAPCPAAP